MSTEPPIPPDDAPPRLLGLVRLVIAFVCLGLPVLGVVGLGWVWYRSVGNLQVVTAGHAAGNLDEPGNKASAAAWQVKAESLEGVLGLTWSRSWWETQTLRLKPGTAVVTPTFASRMFSPAAEQFTQAKGEFGWYWGRAEPGRVAELDALQYPRGREFWELPPVLNLFFGGVRSAAEALAYQPFGRDRSDVGWTRTLHWQHSHKTESKFAGTEESKVEALVAPCWVWMLPLVVPPLWWLWCPPGRAMPRLTIGRSLVATAVAAIILAAVATVGRSSAADRALLVLDEFGGSWNYRRASGGSDRMVVTQVRIDSLHLSAESGAAAARRIHDALTQLPDLKTLILSGSGTKAISSALVATVIAGLPNLENIDLSNATNADDATLEPLRGMRNLRELHLDDTKVTDAGLASIRTLPNLEILWLENLNLTEAGLESLHGMPRLRKINFKGNGKPLGNDALRRLAATLPAFEILWDPGSYSLRKRDLAPAEPDPQPR